MAKYKVMYTDTELPDISIEAEVLSKIGAEVVMPRSMKGADLVECGKGCDGIMVDYAPMPKSVIDQFDKCKVISRQGIGYNNVDVEAASAKGIMVANCPDYCQDEVADHTFALLLTCARRTAAFDAAVRKGIWGVKVLGPMYRLRGQVFALYGFGSIAKKVAVRAAAFGFHVAAFDPYMPDSVFSEAGVKKVDSLEELASIADVFSIHAPVTIHTQGTVNMSILRKMKPTCILINTSRGPLINEEDLAEALEKRMIAMAGLDVLVDEPPAPDNKLLGLENVILTPHVSFYTEESEVELRTRIAEEVVNTLIDGHPQLKSFVNRKDFGY
jgi:D-3-phosphoglycerate dehydrogenase